MREINELTGQIQAALETLLEAKASGDKVRVNVLSSEILGHAIRLPELFQKQKRPDMALSNEMELLRVERDAAFLIMRCFGHMTAVRQQSMGAIFQKLLVHIYDSANDGPHYLARDDVYHAYHRIIAEANLYFAQVVFREQLPDRLNETFIAWIHGIASPIRKAAKRYFRDECHTWGEDVVSDVTFSPKEEGAQIGTKAHVIFADGVPSMTCHVKAHQNYGASSSGLPSSQRKEIDLRELLVYKMLEHIGFGPKVHFITHRKADDADLYHNALFIATQNVSHTKVVGKEKQFHKARDLFSYDRDEFKGDPVFFESYTAELREAATSPTKLAATIFDLLGRILYLTDMNEDNFGRINSAEKVKWKMVDFMINPVGRDYYLGKDRGVEGFIKGNGAFRYTRKTLLSTALTERDRSEKIIVGKEAIELLHGGRRSLSRPETHKMGFVEAIERAFREVLEYMEADIGGQSRAALLGLHDARTSYAQLREYVDAALANFHDFLNGFQTRYIHEIASTCTLGTRIDTALAPGDPIQTRAEEILRWLEACTRPEDNHELERGEEENWFILRRGAERRQIDTQLRFNPETRQLSFFYDGAYHELLNAEQYVRLFISGTMTFGM